MPIDFRYRFFLVSHLVELFAVPVAAVFGGLRLLDVLGYGAVSAPARIALYTISPLVFGVARVNFSRWHDERKAKKAGVPLPKLIVGKKIGNVDILKR